VIQTKDDADLTNRKLEQSRLPRLQLRVGGKQQSQEKMMASKKHCRSLTTVRMVWWCL